MRGGPGFARADLTPDRLKLPLTTSPAVALLNLFPMGILIAILTFVLILVSLFLILIVLAQKAKSDGGVGAAMGGGMAEATFGAETGNVLTKATINASIAFFILSFILYLGHIYQHKHGAAGSGDALPAIPASATPAPATSGAAAPGAATTAAPVESSPAAPAQADVPAVAPAPGEGLLPTPADKAEKAP